MKLSQVVFRITFIALAIIYVAVLAEFLNPQYFNVNVEIRYDALALTALIVGYLYFFLKRAKF
jgi:uncharacterized membrane protein